MLEFTIPEEELRAQAKQAGKMHLSTGIAVARSGKILIVRRAPDDTLGGNFELPGGGIEDGETFEASVRRELREETGLVATVVLGMFPGFDYATRTKPAVRQFNFLVSVEDAPVQLSHEHDQCLWIDSEDEIDQLSTTEAMRICLKDALAVAEDLNSEA